jgi:toxin ParE1/3/4
LSIAQAEAYVRTITGDLDWLLLNSEVSRERREFRSAVRLRRSRLHPIICGIEPGWLSVLRIVHARQN